MNKNDNDSFINDTTRAILGSVNGIVFYDLIWPFISLLLFQLILNNNYQYYVDNHRSALSLSISIVSCLFCLIVSIIIANPKKLQKAYKMIQKKDIKIILITLLYMFAFTYLYNFALIILGVDVSGGNANQELVNNYIKSDWFLSFISMVLIAPIAEEITYRYFLFGGIRKYNKKLAIILSGFIFMVVHALASIGSDNMLREILLLPPYMFSGMALAYAYNETENLTISTSIHLLNNLIALLICLI